MLVLIAAGLLLAVATSRLLRRRRGNKEVTITGKWSAANARCMKPRSCQNVVQVQKDGKTVNYYLTQNDVSKAAHDADLPRVTPKK